MPHYKDGTEAKVGDHVTGKPYNTDHEIAGTVVSISPGTDTCNMQVEFIESAATGTEFECGGYKAKSPRMALPGDPRLGLTESHGSAGEAHGRFLCRDYGEVKAFTLVARPGHVK